VREQTQQLDPGASSGGPLPRDQFSEGTIDFGTFSVEPVEGIGYAVNVWADTVFSRCGLSYDGVNWRGPEGGLRDKQWQTVWDSSGAILQHLRKHALQLLEQGVPRGRELWNRLDQRAIELANKFPCAALGPTPKDGSQAGPHDPRGSQDRREEEPGCQEDLSRAKTFVSNAMNLAAGIPSGSDFEDHPDCKEYVNLAARFNDIALKYCSDAHGIADAPCSGCQEFESLIERMWSQPGLCDVIALLD